jgi:hypothetical protein
MAAEVMRRSAADNRYFHPDFHGSLSAGLDFVAGRWGAGAVREYLRRFALRYYAPLRAEIGQRGLAALRDWIESVYRDEGGTVDLALTEGRLEVRVPECPAVRHMRRAGYRVSDHFIETTTTVYEALCEGTPFIFELEEYHPATGRAAYAFRRRP